MPPDPLFFLVACEPSGDALGAGVMAALKARLDGRVRFAGVGGPRMAAEGLDSLFPQSDLALFGVFEVLPKIPRVLRRLRETAQAAQAARPVLVLTIDGPDFSFRLAKRLRGKGIPLVHYVAPSVWAWRAGRARKIARLYDHLLALLPFEPPFFTREGLPCAFTGHPAAANPGAEDASCAALRRKLGIPADRKILCVLPGSRRGEIGRLAPVFGKTLGLLGDIAKDSCVVLPTLPHVADMLKPHLARWPVKPVLLVSEEEKYAAFRACHAALAASGTVSLELAMAGAPHVIAYKLNGLTAILFALFVRLKFVNLVNILLQRMVIPEYLQLRCTPALLAEGLRALWIREEARARQKQAFGTARARLLTEGKTPSEKAAEVLREVAGV